MSDFAKNFAENLRFYRKKLKLTQKEFAEQISYSEKAVSKWECGEATPNIETLFKIAATLKVNVDLLCKDKKIYYLGIDGGGTKTDLALADAEGKIVRTLKTDACNPMDIGIEAAKQILRNAIHELCEGISFSNIYAFAGIAGGTTADMQQQLKLFFEEFGFAKFENDSDNKNILAAGLGNSDGITVILGTGVCVFAQKNKQTRRLAGWGYLIDNGGSGYNLGRDALNAYFSAADGSGESTLLTEEINKRCPGGPSAIMGHIYNGGKKAVASYAPALFSALKKGDALAENILKRNMDTVAHLIETAAKDFTAGKIPVVLVGGLTSQPIVTDYLKKALSAPERYAIKTPDTAPVYGAIMLAQQLYKENK